MSRKILLFGGRRGVRLSYCDVVVFDVNDLCFLLFYLSILHVLPIKYDVFMHFDEIENNLLNKNIELYRKHVKTRVKKQFSSDCKIILC